MLSVRSIFCAFSAFIFLPVVGFSQPGSSPASAYFVQDKIASSDQGLELEFGTTLAMGGDIMVASDENEHVEILRRNPDGSWTLEAVLSAPDAGTDFGTGGFSLATNGEWVAVGAQGDDTFGTNAGAVHLYRYDGLDWQYEGKLSHMAPFGSIGYDNFGMSVAMDGDRMVMGSKAENGAGAKGAIHYFQYNAMLDMWLETGFIASTHTTGSSTTRFALSIDISGDYLIAGEYGNPDNGALAGAAHIYKFYNQCWHLEMTFLGHEAGDRLGTDVSISGNRAVAGSPKASLNGNTSLDLNDTIRINYHRDYLTELRHAIFQDGADVRGYFVWSLLDNVEWGDGLRDRFGLFKVEGPSLQRVPKRSVLWFQHFIETWYSE